MGKSGTKTGAFIQMAGKEGEGVAGFSSFHWRWLSVAARDLHGVFPY